MRQFQEQHDGCHLQRIHNTRHVINVTCGWISISHIMATRRYESNLRNDAPHANLCELSSVSKLFECHHRIWSTCYCLSTPGSISTQPPVELWPILRSYVYIVWRFVPVNKLVPATSFLWVLYKSRVYDYDYDYIMIIYYPVHWRMNNCEQLK